jgi:hypothetical protein
MFARPELLRLEPLQKLPTCMGEVSLCILRDDVSDGAGDSSALGCPVQGRGVHARQ